MSFRSFIQKFMNILQQLVISLSHATFRIRRSQMSDEYSMCTPFGYNTFSYISRSIEIEMRQITYQCFRPVCL